MSGEEKRWWRRRTTWLRRQQRHKTKAESKSKAQQRRKTKTEGESKARAEAEAEGVEAKPNGDGVVGEAAKQLGAQPELKGEDVQMAAATSPGAGVCGRRGLMATKAAPTPDADGGLGDLGSKGVVVREGGATVAGGLG